MDSVFLRGLLHNTFVLQVYNILQPLSICLSYQSTLDTVDELCVDYDADVRDWRDTLQRAIQAKSPVPLPTLGLQGGTGEVPVSYKVVSIVC